MARSDYEKLCADAYKLATFTTSQLHEYGYNRYTIAAAVQDGYLVVVGTVDNGRPGKNPYKLQLTAKGARLARNYQEHLIDLVRWGDDAG